MDNTQSQLVMYPFDTAMRQQAYQCVIEVGKQQLLIPKAHSQHSVEKLSNGLVLLKYRVDWPASFKRYMLTDIIVHQSCSECYRQHFFSRGDAGHT